MRKYEADKPSKKSQKDSAVKINNRFYGSTHESATKKRIVRVGKKRARREAKEQILEE